MGEDVPETKSVGSSDRRSFLRKAGVVAGAAWVAPTVLSLSSPAAAASAPFKVSIPFGPGPAVPISCNGGSVHLEFLQLPDPWVVNLVSTVPIEIVALNLVSSPGVTIVTPTPGPPNFPVTTTILNIRGTGVPQIQSFFDVFYNCAP